MSDLIDRAALRAALPIKNPDAADAMQWGYELGIDAALALIDAAPRAATEPALTIDVKRLAQAMKDALVVGDKVTVEDILNGGMPQDIALHYEALATPPSAPPPRTVFTDVTVASAKDANFAVIYEGDGSQSGWTEGATAPSAPLEETP